jgi:hypothetical protein
MFVSLIRDPSLHLLELMKLCALKIQLHGELPLPMSLLLQPFTVRQQENDDPPNRPQQDAPNYSRDSLPSRASDRVADDRPDKPEDEDADWVVHNAVMKLTSNSSDLGRGNSGTKSGAAIRQ